MPTPIQQSSITNKLRSFFRLRGRQIFTLDETTVPVVAVEDLTTAPYRGNHQVRWKVARQFNAAIIPAREFMLAINLSDVAVMSIADVPGVAVIEELELLAWSIPAVSQWTIDLVNHTGFLGSLEPGAVITMVGSDVDAAETVPVPALGVRGATPIRLNGVQQNIAPALGTLLHLGDMRLPSGAPGLPQRIMSAEQVVIGDNVALLIMTTVPIVTGTIQINVSGSYYPLARS